jgi:hypothetical protein
LLTNRSRIIEAQNGAEHVLVTILPDSSQPSRTAIIVVWKKS